MWLVLSFMISIFAMVKDNMVALIAAGLFAIADGLVAIARDISSLKDGD